MEEFLAFSVLAFNLATERARELKGDNGWIIPHTIHTTGAVADRIARPPDLPALFKNCQESFLISASFQQQIALFEYFVFDAVRLVLCDEPKRLPANKKVDLAVITSATTREQIIQDLVERELNELRYKGVGDWFAYLEQYVNGVAPSAEVTSQIAEAKATRDLLVHNRGVINEVYLRKAGQLARGKIGEVVPMPPEYRAQNWRLLVQVVATVSTLLIDKLEKPPA